MLWRSQKLVASAPKPVKSKSSKTTSSAAKAPLKGTPMAKPVTKTTAKVEVSATASVQSTKGTKGTNGKQDEVRAAVAAAVKASLKRSEGMVTTTEDEALEATAAKATLKSSECVPRIPEQARLTWVFL